MSEKEQIDIRVTLETNDHFSTRFKGSLEEAQKYYISRTINLGKDPEGNETLVKATKVELVFGHKH